MDGFFGVSSNKGIRKRYCRTETHPTQPIWERLRVYRAFPRLRAAAAGTREPGCAPVTRCRLPPAAQPAGSLAEPRPRSESLLFFGRGQRCRCLQKQPPTAARVTAGRAEPLLASAGTGVAAGAGGERATLWTAVRRQASGFFCFVFLPVK